MISKQNKHKIEKPSAPIYELNITGSCCIFKADNKWQGKLRLPNFNKSITLILSF